MNFNFPHSDVMLRPLIISVLCLTGLLHAQEIQLQSPLTTQFTSTQRLPPQCVAIQTQIHVPANAPNDLGVGAFIKDDDGRWFQLAHKQQLQPGIHHLHFPLNLAKTWTSEPGLDHWNNYRRGLGETFGLFFWSQQENNANITVEPFRLMSDSDNPKQSHGLYNIQYSHHPQENQKIDLACGDCFEVSAQVDPMPFNPFNTDLMSMKLIIVDKHLKRWHFPAFYRQKMRFDDLGNKDHGTPVAQPDFCMRFRPKHPGIYRAIIEVHWKKDDALIKIPLPDFEVSGQAQESYVHVDKSDARFFSIGNKDPQFIWPNGINLRSVTDSLGTERTYTKATPERIFLAYKDYLERLSKAGANCAEIWLSSWNLGLEWNDDWPGFNGVGNYHLENAERLDQLLAHAEKLGMYIVLVVNNHGQASTYIDKEWETSPFNKNNGGPIPYAKDMFSSHIAKRFQRQHRRYLIGRYAHYRSILTWKLWTELDLTDARSRQIVDWHKAALAAWHTEDNYYQHPCATHWSGNYLRPDRNLCALPELDVIAIDAYHKNDFLPQLLYNSSLHPRNGLSQFTKPLIVTEFGGNWDACPMPQLEAEHASGFWAALVSGHASSPHLWWFEWVDQGNRWRPYRAINNFLVGEDLRGEKARSVLLDLRKGPQQETSVDYWARAWMKPGTLLGYICDRRWANHGDRQLLHTDCSILLGTAIKAGLIHIEWWDPHQGTCISSVRIEHPGGALSLPCPSFRRHLAFKCKRLP